MPSRHCVSSAINTRMPPYPSVIRIGEAISHSNQLEDSTGAV
jgi:hypothetical protein